MTDETLYNSLDQITDRINKLYLANIIYLKNTQAETYIKNFVAKDPKDNADLYAIVSVLDYYLNDETVDQTLYHFDSVNNILVALENELIARSIGFEKLSSANAKEYFGLDEYINTAAALIGSKSVASVIKNGDQTITGLLGNEALASFVVLGQNYLATSSISDQLDIYNKAFTSSIGKKVNLNIGSSINLHSCLSSDIIGSQILSTHNNPTLVDSINGFYACATWASNPEFLGLIDVNHDYACISSVEENLFNNCLVKLSGE